MRQEDQNKIPEPEYINVEFTVETPTQKNVYVYNFNQMTMDRILQATEMFRVLEELRQNPPASLRDTKVTIERQIERNAFAAILMKKQQDRDGNITFEKYEPGIVSSFDFLAELKGADNFAKLQEVKTDFFMHTGMLLGSSMKELSGITKSLNGIDKEKIELVIDLIKSKTEK